jgi:hypothetical protein
LSPLAHIFSMEYRSAVFYKTHGVTTGVSVDTCENVVHSIAKNLVVNFGKVWELF